MFRSGEWFYFVPFEGNSLTLTCYEKLTDLSNRLGDIEPS